MRLAVLLSFSGAGGVEKMMMNLIREFAKRLDSIDVLLIRAKGPHLQALPSNVRVLKLKANHTFTAIPELVGYLKENKPDALLVAKDRAGRAAVRARSLAGVNTRIVVRLGTNLSAALKHKSALSAWFRVSPMRKIYSRVDHVVAVSEGVKADVVSVTKLNIKKISVIRNPVITERFYEGLELEAPHPWLSDNKLSVVLGVGRLSEQKDFCSLIKAFYKIHSEQECLRLIIVGEGGQRALLEELINKLNISDSVLMPGFQPNVLNWVKHADLFVLSSRWEGSPNALTEALALGVPSVSTRCPSGPDETLKNGEYGPLVSVGDVDGLVSAMKGVLSKPLPPEVLKNAVVEYQASRSAEHYLRILQGVE